MLPHKIIEKNSFVSARFQPRMPGSQLEILSTVPLCSSPVTPIVITQSIMNRGICPTSSIYGVIWANVSSS